MKQVIAYIRVSTDGQVGEDKFGLDAQREQIEEYCKAHDMWVAKWVTDAGESGAKFRVQLDEIVYSELRNPPIEAVVVAKNDRIARDVQIYYYYKGALRRKGIELISVTEDFGDSGLLSNVLEMFTALCAEQERQAINYRMSAGRKQKAKQGGYSGGRPPFGYTAVNKQLIINEEEAECVRIAFYIRDVLGGTYVQTAEYLNVNGYRSRSNKLFVHNNIMEIIRRKRFYQGIYTYGELEVAGQHEPIIPNDDKLEQYFQDLGYFVKIPPKTVAPIRKVDQYGMSEEEKERYRHALLMANQAKKERKKVQKALEEAQKRMEEAGVSIAKAEDTPTVQWGDAFNTSNLVVTDE